MLDHILKTLRPGLPRVKKKTKTHTHTQKSKRKFGFYTNALDKTLLRLWVQLCLVSSSVLFVFILFILGFQFRGTLEYMVKQEEAHILWSGLRFQSILTV